MAMQEVMCEEVVVLLVNDHQARLSAGIKQCETDEEPHT
jgi:hypothetical protein